jgi:sporulation protein YlmC with PRC-barrel domain
MTLMRNATISRLSDTGLTIIPSTEDLRGRTVVDRDGRVLGKVHDLLIDDQQHKPRFLLVAHGGFLGLGEAKSFIPVDAITEITENHVRIDHTLEHVAAAPPYDPSLIAERSYHRSVYDHYGYQPYWAAGHRYPDYPGAYLPGQIR